MNAEDILNALRHHYPTAAFVPELTINDEQSLTDYYEQGEHEAFTRRIDALMFDKRIRTAIEIKVDRADAKRESLAKVRAWRQVTHRFFYATPAGLIDSPPIMSGSIGLLWVHPDGRIEWRRKCRLNPSPEPLPLIVQERIAHRASHYALIPKELRP